MIKQTFTFKNDSLSNELDYVHPRLRELFYTCVAILNAKGLSPVVTSILRKRGEIPGESGVHSTLRAMDFVTSAKAQTNADIAQKINALFPRADGKPTLMWHDVGYGEHFHLQVPWTPNFMDANGSLDGRSKTT